MAWKMALGLVLTGLLLVGTAQARSLELGIGAIGERDSDTTTLLQAALVSDPVPYLVGMQIQGGLLLAQDDTVYLHGGLTKVWELPGRWSWGGSLSAGFYHTNEPQLELGHDIEFMTRLHLDYELSIDQSLRLEVGHLSNADLDDENPGTEFILLNWLIRL
ncbi:MAG: acyloxyacyl hydrolase [Marinobacterium sp.]|nr:acyloxyacyl hydrolase [Marinobacterium sp.]